MAFAEVQKEFHNYLAHQDEFVKDYAGRVLLIKDGKVHGAYATDLEALQAGLKLFGPGTFLVMPCSPGDGAYTATFHSNVQFL